VREDANDALLDEFIRETDCFERRDNEWQLIHQHASIPAGGEWDGKIVTDAD
jgi:hypothetical protein